MPPACPVVLDARCYEQATATQKMTFAAKAEPESLVHRGPVFSNDMTLHRASRWYESNQLSRLV
jgi:hypothetical protein